MKWKEMLEKIGYHFFLQYDIGIQYEFNLIKQRQKTGSYMKKLLLLIQLLLKRRFLGISFWEEWYKKQKRLIFPEWNSENVRFDINKELILSDDVDLLIIDFRNVLLWPILNDRCIMDAFLRYQAGLDADETDKSDRYRCLWKELHEFSIVNEDIRSILCSFIEKDNKVILVDEDELEVSLINGWLGENNYSEKIHVTLQAQLSEVLKQQKFKHAVYLCLKRNKCFCGNVSCVEIPDVIKKGEFYRPFPGYGPIECAYNTMMNVKFHWRVRKETIDFFYGFGFKYGGILAAGICQWLNQIVNQFGFDLLIFTSRDCEILFRAYCKWFCKTDCKYIYISRRALLEAMFETCPKAYRGGVFIPKISYEDSVSVGALFRDMEIDFLLDDLKNVGLKEDSLFDYAACEKISEIFDRRNVELSDHFRKYRNAAPVYLKKYFNGKGKVCVIDLGWKGTIVRLLKQMQKEQGWDCEIKGALVAAMEDEYVMNASATGDIVTYLFSNERTQPYRQRRGIPYNHQQIKCIETLFSSPEGTLTHYDLDSNGDIRLVVRDKNPNAVNIQNIHRGIMDFLDGYIPFINHYCLKLSVDDSFAPLSAFLDDKQLVKMLLRHLA